MFSIIIDNSHVIKSPEVLSCEWLETNGIGGYASSSILNCHTRKYHGLLIANLATPPGRYVLLSKTDDFLLLDGEEYPLTAHQFPEYFSPGAQSYLVRFEGIPHPRFIYKIDKRILEKEIQMIQGVNAILLKYTLKGAAGAATIRFRPFLAYRRIHDLASENVYLQKEVEKIADGYRITPYEGMPPLVMQISEQTEFIPENVWYRHFEYAKDRERGYNFQEDLFSPGIIEMPIEKGKEIFLCFSTEPCTGTIKKTWNEQLKKRISRQEQNNLFAETFTEDKDILNVLLKAADQFIIRTPSERHTVIAGYHWFYDWGRDTLISLPGLTFCRQNFVAGEEILKTFAEFERYGLFPNFFAEDGAENAYNTVDASLWYFWAVQQYLKYGGDYHWVHHHIWPVLKRILKQFMAGTLYDICMDSRGLISAGSAGTRLTWMDASVNGIPATPRWGYMVEINALWYNAICFSHELAEKYDDREFFFKDLITLLRQSFRETFWISDGRYLGDIFCNNTLDTSVRPNQIFAVSLPYSPLDPADWLNVVNKVEMCLLASCGLKTLSSDDSAYRGRYEGPMTMRDSAYHQGTVWPWLWGHFGEAYLKAHKSTSKAKKFLRKNMYDFLQTHLTQAGLGCVSEVFDGDPPHRPDGCISQAWSTAELIRLLTVLRDVPAKRTKRKE